MIRLGIERFLEEPALSQKWHGARVGLFTHLAAVDRDLVSTLDRIAQHPAWTLQAIFTPEHGLFGVMQAGASVEDERHPQYGVPIYSLYGVRKKPTPEMLADIDVLLIDCQDVGVRFYTYISALGDLLEAAGEQNVPVIVLDRPNPLGGMVAEGPLLQSDQVSYVGRYPQLPLRYGLTFGELARWIAKQKRAETPRDFQARSKVETDSQPLLHRQPFVHERLLPNEQQVSDLPSGGLQPHLHQPALEVIPMEGWHRTLSWEATGLPWVPPSPNMPTVETAIVYPGMAFFEGTNVSEGRGTTKPFEWFGAPWVEPAQVMELFQQRSLPGVKLREVHFTPTISKHQGMLCHGAQVHVTDRMIFRPVLTALHLLDILKRLYPQEFAWTPPHNGRFFIDLLAGTDELRLAIESGQDPNPVYHKWEKSAEQFHQSLASYFLYRES